MHRAAKAEECVGPTYLLDREPKESTLPAFDIAVIRRYFPGFDEVFPAYLARA